MFFPIIYKSWKKAQEEKYRDILNLTKSLFNKNNTRRFSVLDIGIGKAWFYYFSKLGFREVVGVDLNEKRVRPRKKEISYILKSFENLVKDKSFMRKKFDVLISIDALNLLDRRKLREFLEKKRFFIYVLAVPLRERQFLKEISNIIETKNKIEKTVGEKEKDFLVICYN